jgi:hypothetical protein
MSAWMADNDLAGPHIRDNAPQPRYTRRRFWQSIRENREASLYPLQMSESSTKPAPCIFPHQRR